LAAWITLGSFRPKLQLEIREEKERFFLVSQFSHPHFGGGDARRRRSKMR
jgi:hypothetical protein